MFLMFIKAAHDLPILILICLMLSLLLLTCVPGYLYLHLSNNDITLTHYQCIKILDFHNINYYNCEENVCIQYIRKVVGAFFLVTMPRN